MARSRNRSMRLNVEALEDRLAPATAIWTGAGANDQWTNAANWTRDGVVAAAPVAGDDLVFDAGFIGTTINDFALGTSFRSITFLADSYTLTGNLIVLTNGITVGQNGGTNTINLDIGLNGNQTFNNLTPTSTLVINGVLSLGNATLTLDGQGITTVNNSLSSSNVGSLVKAGTGTATLLNNSPSFDGAIFVNNGILEATVAGSLGTTIGNTTVNGGTLQLNGQPTNAIIPELININGTGFAGFGAIHGISNTTLTGTINLDSDARITMRNNIQLTVNGSLVGNANLHLISGSGTFLLQTLSTLNGDVTVSGALLQLREFGQMLNVGEFTVDQSGRLLIDNNGTQILGNRIGDTTDVNLNSGLLWMRTRSGQPGNEVMGDVNLVAGHNRIFMDATTSAALTSLRLESSGLFRNTGATLEFIRSGFEIGNASNRVFFGVMGVSSNLNPGLTAANVLPFAYINVAVGNTGSKLVTYDITTGIGPRAFDITAAVVGDLAGATASSVVNFTANITLTGNVVIGAGVFAADVSGGRTLALATFNLTVDSGVLLATYQDDNVTISNTTGSLIFGSPTDGSTEYTDGNIFLSSGQNISLNTTIAGDAGLTDGLNLVDVDNFDGERIIFGGSTNNTYTGATRVLAGTLTLNKSSNVTAITGDLIIGDDSGSGTADGVIIQTGLAQIAPGNNILIRGAGSLTNSVANYVLDSFVTLEAGRSDGLINAVNGNAVLTTSTNLVLAQDVIVALPTTDSFPFAGQAVISGGTLFLNPADPGTRTFTVADGVAVNDLQITSVIATSVAEDLVKMGDGVLVLTSSNAANQGDLIVNEGTLIFSGIMSGSDVIVGSGGTFGGNGTVQILNVQTGGTVSPGWAVGPDGRTGSLTNYAGNNPIGTLIVTSGATFATGSTLVIQVNSVTVFDRLQINNIGLTVDPGATLTVNVNGFTQPGVVDNVVQYLTSTNTGEFNNLNVIGTSVVQVQVLQDYLPGGLDLNIVEATVPVASSIIAVAANKGKKTIEVYDSSDNSLLYVIDAFSGTGHMEVAVGDMNGDTVLDIVASQKGQVKIFDGLNGTQFPGGLGSIKPFGGGYKGTLYIGVGDLDNDLGDDLAVGRGSGKSTVKVYSTNASTLTQTATWKAHGNTGGVRVAVGNLDGIGNDEIVTATGKDVKSQIKVWDSTGLLFGTSIAPYGTNKSGVFISVGDLDGNDQDDIVVSSQSANATRLVTVLDGEDAMLSTVTILGTPFLPFPSGSIRTAVADLDNDGDFEIAATRGSTGRLVKYFDLAGTDLLADFSAYDAAFNGGLSLGAGTR